MRVLALDLETDGVDTRTSQITELGWVVWDCNTAQPLLMGGGFVRGRARKIPPEVVALNGITDEICEAHGRFLPELMAEMAQAAAASNAERLVGHNATTLDIPILRAEVARMAGVNFSGLLALPLIDTRVDLPFPPNGTGSRKLVHLAAEHGFLNPFGHRAVFDCLTTLRLMSCYPLDVVIARSDSPTKVVRALSTYEQRGETSKLGFRWQELDGEMFQKMWVQRVKACDMDTLKEKCLAAGFGIQTLR